MSEANGAMRPDSQDGDGLWIGDTRYLSEFLLRIDGHEPVATAVRAEAACVHMEVVASGMDVRRERFVEAGLHERVTITNPGPSAARVELELTLGADFAAMLAVRGFLTEVAMPPQAVPTRTGRGVVLNDPAGTRATEVVIQPPETTHRVELRPSERFTLVIDVLPQRALRTPDFDIGLAGLRDAYKRWAADCTSFETDNPAINELLQTSRDDLWLLCERYPTGIYPTGGIPWYAVPFGRDALFTALFTLDTNPEIARGTLRFLAVHQGRVEDPANEEEPGKILHEVRTGELVERGLWPHIFFGTVDATPLFLAVIAETLDWTGDGDLIEELWPAAEAALAWCQRYGDREYVGGRGRNQGWKDSDDSLTHIDGTDPIRPTALAEVQGYLYRALLLMAGKRPELKAKVAELKRRFNRDFWMGKDRFVAQALDGAKRPVEAVSSNPGHCLWAGILEPAKARAVADRLVSPDLFSGWGIRTLSSRAVNYSPRNPSNGCVVPFDSAIAASGLRRAGYVKAAELVARSVLEAGIEFGDGRLPEFWCGFDRLPNRPPEQHGSSCSPQSWSAASAFSLVTTLLGLTADATRGRLRIDPCRTPLWSRIEVHGLHFAGRRLDFPIEGDRVKIGAIPRGMKIET